VEDVFGEMCVLACTLAHAARSSISYRDIKAGKVEVIARSSGPPRQHDIKYALPKVSRKTPVYLVSNAEEAPDLIDYPGNDIFPNLRSVAAYWLGTHKGYDHFLIIWNPAQCFFNNTANEKAMDHIVAILKDLLIQSDKLQKTNPATTMEQMSERAVPAIVSPAGGAATRFLIDTLVTKQRLLARNGCSYVALRQWRKSIKPYQISALAALKACNDDCFEDEIATEMSAAIKRVYGDAFQFVVPIPGGSSSRSDSLSVRLAERIAKNLNAEFANVLVGQPVAKGKSHPAKSAALKPYLVNGNIRGNVLIVDDVSTSGRHIELATQAIRPLATYCTSVVWIAA
jgi:hypothetical protein